jgi:hypothetical protein
MPHAASAIALRPERLVGAAPQLECPLRLGGAINRG